MKQLIILSLILTLSLISSSCKKKYPDGTPTWLINKIKIMEQDAKGYRDCDGTCRIVEEYTDGSSTYYWIGKGGSMVYTTVYDYYGTELCTFYLQFSGSCSQDKKTYVRRIWIETH